MNGLILALALMGQQCGPQGCDPVARSRIESPLPPVATSWHDYCVRVIVDNGDSQSLGSGTVISSGYDGKKLVLTASHVLGGSRRGISVRYRDRTYPARFLAVADEGDLAALEASLPGDLRLPIASEAPRTASMMGFGSNGKLHYHSGRLTGHATPRGDRTPDMAFSFTSDQGDSGGGVFNDRGEFAGVVWGGNSSGAMAVSTYKLHQFLGAKTQSANGRKIVTISPFFIKIRREWSNPEPPAVVVSPAPAPPTTPTTPEPTPPTPPMAPTVDLSGIQKDIADLKTSVAGLTTSMQGLTTSVASISSAVKELQSTVAKPIKLRTPNPNAPGGVSVSEVHLGETATLNPFSVSSPPVPGK